MSHKFNINLSAPAPVQTQPAVKSATQAKPAHLANGRFAPKTTAQLPPAKTLRKRPSRAKPVQPTATQTLKPVLTNRVAIILDESGSMGWLTSAVKKNFDELVKGLIDNKDVNQQTFVSVYTFSNNVHLKESQQKPERLSALSYYPNGGTALFDAVGQAVNDFKFLPDHDDKNTSFLLIVLTDGQENQSHSYTADKIKELIAARQKTDRWTFTFQVPNGYKSYLTSFGIPTDNIREWDATEKGLAQTTQSTNIGTQSYFTARAAGQTSVKKFYQTDLSNVTKKDLSQLTDLSGQYKLHNVQTEEAIKAFVESRLKIKYASGIAFYQLMKKEKIQAGKQLLIMDKVSRKIWGGLEARNLLGLPTTADCFVDPLNHGAYEVFVQSTSVNRKLPRGTKILVKV